MKKIKVLIADDSKILNDFTRLALEKDETIEIVGTAEDGETEYNLIKEKQPDLVITDNKMPKMCGIEVIEKIYNEKLQKKPNFFIVTGDSLNNIDFAKLNIVYQFDKPIDYEELHRKVISFWKKEC